jgi:hypothetical protein
MPRLIAQPDDFKLAYEWAIIEHLGLNLYSEVHSAISELVANAYDADASTVDVTLPIGVKLGHRDQEIVISDDGHGMTYGDCRDRFLKIGRNRRRSSTKSKSGRRDVIGKKGIGKLAGFGIADEIVVRTVAGGLLNEFVLSLRELRNAPVNVAGEKAEDAPDVTGEYKPKLLRHNVRVKEANGTRVTLRELRDLGKVDFDDFMTRMSRKFAIFSDDFVVRIHKAHSADVRMVEKYSVETQFRFPGDGWGEEWVDTPTLGERKVQYWVGFTKKPIKADAQRGISVVANGKSVQEPFDFRIAGGVEGQFGLQYMTGEVHADWLDLPNKVDVIASDRASVRWSDIDANALLVWGQEKVKACLEEWAELRKTATIQHIKEIDPAIYEQIDAYTGPAKEELRRVVDRVVESISPLAEVKRIDVVRSIVVAYSHDYIRGVLTRVLASNGGWDEWVRALAEWDVIDAVLTFQELSVKLAAIQTLEILIQAGATEVRSKSGLMSLHEHLAAHPWLLDPMFREMESEINLDRFLTTQFTGAKGFGDEKRVDFIALYDGAQIRIVEIKSAKSPLDERGVLNLMNYHKRVKDNEGKRNQPRRLRSTLIYNGTCTDDALGPLDQLMTNRDEYEVFTWQELSARNTMIYKEMLRRVHAKAPGDPRVKPLWDQLQARDRAASSAADRSMVGSTSVAASPTVVPNDPGRLTPKRRRGRGK